jgi:hypothetical protein
LEVNFALVLRRTIVSALAFAAVALAVAVPAAARVSNAPVVLHGSPKGLVTWKFSAPDTGRSNTFRVAGIVSPLGVGTVFIGSEQFPGFVAHGYVLGRGKLKSAQGTIALSFRFGPYKGFTSTITTPGTYHIKSGTGQFVGATGNGTIREKIGAAGGLPNTNKVKFMFNPPVPVAATK